MTVNGNNANLLKTCFENICEIVASELIFWRALAITYNLYCYLERFNKKLNGTYSFSILNCDFYADGGNFLTFGLESKSTILYLVINV